MAETQPRRRAVGDEAALLFVVSVLVGAVTMAVIRAVIGRGVLGEALGFLGMWAAIFPFARRMWAADASAWQFWRMAIMATAFGAALRLLIR